MFKTDYIILWYIMFILYSYHIILFSTILNVGSWSRGPRGPFFVTCRASNCVLVQWARSTSGSWHSKTGRDWFNGFGWENGVSGVKWWVVEGSNKADCLTNLRQEHTLGFQCLLNSPGSCCANKTPFLICRKCARGGLKTHQAPSVTVSQMVSGWNH